MVDIYKLHPIFRKKVLQFFNNLLYNQIKFKITSTYRSFEDQYFNKYVRNKKEFANPLSSYHVKGRAIDIMVDEKDRKKVKQVARAFGLYVFDEKAVGLPHLHIDDRYSWKEYTIKGKIKKRIPDFLEKLVLGAVVYVIIRKLFNQEGSFRGFKRLRQYRSN